MSIPQQIDTRTVRAVAQFFRDDADYAALTDDGKEIHEGSFFDRDNQSLSLKRRRMHVYAAGFTKTPAVGHVKWDYRFTIVIEWFSPRFEPVPAAGIATPFDEAKEIGNRVYCGMVARAPGRFEDPDSPGTYLTLGVEQIVCSAPAALANNAAILRQIEIDFYTEETPEGTRS